jgi:hypothetical protein
MPQFEIEPTDQSSTFVRARTDVEAVTRHLRVSVDELTLGDAEAGSGWRTLSVRGTLWGRIRPRDRMRFRRD